MEILYNIGTLESTSETDLLYYLLHISFQYWRLLHFKTIILPTMSQRIFELIIIKVTNEIYFQSVLSVLQFLYNYCNNR